ncbi:MAG: UDP-N-acetylglucosamine--N-acetylmuramyl-(pentapeptide) pyrophosphoryl-undecaprenol N-acetylglucosamine transferase [Planctomycetes bacterium ADurb.Bin126]|nr:MAG: UDP-N-acetylglucosamine--N-acetylmuramyl-(pentapeptide) pyrophosphoryl-undecaprenol N-acetylglucosamine transferase [Planctomycetes bacterium ADurb.Bin126]
MESRQDQQPVADPIDNRQSTIVNPQSAIQNPPLFLFAGGGTGGHIYPGLAVAGELRRLLGEVKIVFACSDRAIDRRILDPLDHAVVPQPVLPLPRRPLQVVPFLRAWFRSRRQAADMIADLRPAAVLGLGGFAAGPVVCRAFRRDVPTALLNPDAVPGAANRYLARFADAIFTQFENSTPLFKPHLRDKVRCVGCPVRPELLGGDRDQALRRFDLRADRKTLLVLGGSLGAESINKAIDLLRGDLEKLTDTWQVLHVTGPQKSATPGADQRTGHFSDPGSSGLLIRTLEYCNDMGLAYAAADLALARAGAGTVAELSATATPAIFMPYPYHKDQHQRLNAEGPAAAGAAILCEDLKDPAANAHRLRQTLLPVLRDSSRLASMTHAARAASKPRAAQEVALWLAAYAGMQRARQE